MPRPPMPRRTMPLRLRAALLLLAMTLALGLWVHVAGTPGFDAPLSRVLAPLRATPGLWQAASFAGDWEVRLAIGGGAAAWLAARRRRAAALVLLTTAAAQTLATSGLKLLYARPRPTMFDHLDRITDLSFPSGHAAQNACLWLLIALLLDRRLLALGGPLILMIGVSRVVLGVHWPSDVLGGWLFGAACALIGADVARRLPDMRKDRP